MRLACLVLIISVVSSAGLFVWQYALLAAERLYARDDLADPWPHELDSDDGLP